MNESDFGWAVIIPAVLRIHRPQDSYPFNHRAFGAAMIATGKGPGDFKPTVDVYGPACHAFQRVMTLALHTSTVSYAAGDYDRFVVNLTIEGARERLKHRDFSLSELLSVIDAWLESAGERRT